MAPCHAQRPLLLGDGGADDRAPRGLPLRGGQDMGETRHPDLDGKDRRDDPEGDADAAPDEQMAARPFYLFGQGGILFVLMLFNSAVALAIHRGLRMPHAMPA